MSIETSVVRRITVAVLEEPRNIPHEIKTIIPEGEVETTNTTTDDEEEEGGETSREEEILEEVIPIIIEEMTEDHR